jgi:hypothetical protein
MRFIRTAYFGTILSHGLSPVKGYSLYYLLHGREITLPNSDNMKAFVAKGNPEQSRKLENLRTCLKLKSLRR